MADPTTTFAVQAKQLREGETLSRSIRLPLADLNEKSVKKKLANLRNSVNQTASRTREATGYGYRVESGMFFTYDSTALFLVVTLTCMEDEGDDDI